jgi:hypothetical protein
MSARVSQFGSSFHPSLPKSFRRNAATTFDVMPRAAIAGEHPISLKMRLELPSIVDGGDAIH